MYTPSKAMTASVNHNLLPYYLVRFVILYSLMMGSFTEAGRTVAKQFTGYRRYGYTLLPEYVDSRVDSVDLIGCTTACVRLPNCTTVSWNAGERACLLSRTDVTSQIGLSNYMAVNVTWVSMSMMKYTVFVGVNSDGSSSRKLTGAQAICSGLYTTMASPADLVHSVALGFVYPYCSWMSDGTVGYIPEGASSITSCPAGIVELAALCVLN